MFYCRCFNEASIGTSDLASDPTSSPVHNEINNIDVSTSSPSPSLNTVRIPIEPTLEDLCRMTASNLKVIIKQLQQKHKEAGIPCTLKLSKKNEEQLRQQLLQYYGYKDSTPRDSLLEEIKEIMLGPRRVLGKSKAAIESEEAFVGSSKKLDLTYLREVSVGFLRGGEDYLRTILPNEFMDDESDDDDMLRSLYSKLDEMGAQLASIQSSLLPQVTVPTPVTTWSSTPSSATPNATAAIPSQSLQLPNSLPPSTSVPVAHSSQPPFSDQALLESNLPSVPTADSLRTAVQQWKDGIWSDLKTKYGGTRAWRKYKDTYSKRQKLFKEFLRCHEDWDEFKREWGSVNLSTFEARYRETRKKRGARLLATEKESDKYKVDGVFSIEKWNNAWKCTKKDKAKGCQEGEPLPEEIITKRLLQKAEAEEAD